MYVEIRFVSDSLSEERDNHVPPPKCLKVPLFKDTFEWIRVRLD